MGVNHLGLKRVPPFEEWRKNKILVVHMEAIHLDVEDCLRSAEIPFKSVAYDTENIESLLPDLLEESFGIVISGSTKKNQKYPKVPQMILESALPKLGLCYGCEALGVYMGSGLIECNSGVGEYGETECLFKPSPLFDKIDITGNVPVYMAHHLMLDPAPEGCTVIATTKQTPVAGFENLDKMVFGLQFHPEKNWLGDIIFKNFYEICRSI